MSKRRTNAEERLTDDRGRSPAFIFDLDGTLVDSVYQHVRRSSTPVWSCRSGGFTAASA